MACRCGAAVVMLQCWYMLVQCCCRAAAVLLQCCCSAVVVLLRCSDCFYLPSNEPEIALGRKGCTHTHSCATPIKFPSAFCHRSPVFRCTCTSPFLFTCYLSVCASAAAAVRHHSSLSRCVVLRRGKRNIAWLRFISLGLAVL